MKAWVVSHLTRFGNTLPLRVFTSVPLRDKFIQQCRERFPDEHYHISSILVDDLFGEEMQGEDHERH